MTISLEFLYGFIAGAFLAIVYYGVLMTLKDNPTPLQVKVFLHVCFLVPLSYILYTLVSR